MGFLAPKMLKKIADELHDAHSLLKRRIHDGLDIKDSSWDDCMAFAVWLNQEC